MPKGLMRKHLLAIALIITVAPGCDNVGWGGIDFEIGPPPDSEVAPVVEEEPEAPPPPTRAIGPVLLAGVRDGERADFVVVGEVRPDGLGPFPDPSFPEDAGQLAEMAAPGTEWVVFSEGVRVGRLVVERSGPAAEFCGARTAISGIVELVPSAADAQRLLALPLEWGASRPREAYREIDHVYDQRVTTLSIASEAIPRYGARWPALGVLDARGHIQAFQLRNTPGQSVAATFIVDDALAVGAPGQRAYSLFVIGQEENGRYREAFTWYRSVDAEGKGAPRYFDHLDWNNDGTDEILLDVFGANERWFAALSRADGDWTRSFEDSCETDNPSAEASPPDDPSGE
jgi:hypothetical protein